MIKLPPLNAKPTWIEPPGLRGIRLLVKPITTAVMLKARQAAAEVHRAAEEKAESGDETNARAEAGIALIRSIAHSVIVAWEGVGDASGNPIEPTREHIDLFIDVPAVFDAFDQEVVLPAMSPENRQAA